MTLSAKEVSAILVTRGDVDLEPILATLPYDEVIVWDNSKRERDAKCYGRFLAIEEAAHDVVYFQDDDVIFTEHEALLAAFEERRITTNMPSPWYERGSYDMWQCMLVGAGSLVPRDLPWPAFERYLASYPEDDLFLTYCDFVHGILTPGKRFDFGYTILPYASGPNRIYTQPGAAERKRSVIDRALSLRKALQAA